MRIFSVLTVLFLSVGLSATEAPTNDILSVVLASSGDVQVFTKEGVDESFYKNLSHVVSTLLTAIVTGPVIDYSDLPLKA